jgi:hypothetical protein
MMKGHTSTARRLRFAAALMVSGAACAFVAAPVEAQQAAASLRGTITDNGQPAGTQVAAVNVDTGYRRVSPISNGAYNFAALLPGRYRLEVTTTNGMRQTDVFTLAVAQNAELSFDLSQGQAAAAPGAAPPSPNAPAETAENAPAGAPGDIIVTGSRIKNLDAGEVGITIDQHTIESLPQNNRNFLAFADLAPGVQFITGSNGNQSLQGGVQRGDAINVFIDGISQKDYVLKNGITGQDSSQGNPFPQLAIAEYKVISQNYKAEFDDVTSTAITAVTKSGTNEFHGDGFFDFSNQSLRAKTPNEKHNDLKKVKTRDEQFGADLGGPIIKDKLHFYVSYEGKRQITPVNVDLPAGVDIDSIPEPYRDSYGEFNRDFHEDMYFGKIDFVPTTEDLFEISGKVRRETGVSWNDGRTAKSAAGNIKNNETRILAHYQHTAGTWINDAKLEYEKSAWNPTPVVDDVQSQFFTGLGDATRPATAQLLIYGGGINYQNKGQKGWTFQNDFTYTGLTGSTIKLGVKAQWVKLNSIQLTPHNPTFFYNVDYATPQDTDGFNDTIPYQMQFGVPVAGTSGGAVRANDFQLGLYIQDDWDITDRFTANIGIRWDMERNAEYLHYVTPPDVAAALRNWTNIDNANFDIEDYISNGKNRHVHTGEFQPRLGFTWDMTPDGRFQLFGGYGRSYNRNQFDFLSLEALQQSYNTLTYRFDNNDPAHPCDPGQCIPWNPDYMTQAGRDALATSATGGGRELDLLNNNLKIPYSDQFSIGTRGRFGKLHAEIGYTHVVSRDGFTFLLANRRADGTFFVPGQPPQPGQQPGSAGLPFGISPPGFGNILIGTNGVATNLDQAYLKLTKDYTKSSPWSFDLTYTFSAAEENRKFGEHYSFDYPSMYAYPWLRSTGVPKHRLIATGSADLPFGFMLSGKLTLQSPPYVYGTLLADVPDPWNYPSVPVTTEGRNKHPFIVGDLWAIRQLDLALTKYIPLGFVYDGAQLRLRADVFNVFNTKNFVDYDGNARGPDFGKRNINSYSIGGYAPRTVKFTVGLSF